MDTLEDRQRQYIIDNVKYLDDMRLRRTCKNINIAKLAEYDYYVDSESNATLLELSFIGRIEKLVLESDKFAESLAYCNRLMAEKFGDKKTYLLYKKHAITLDRLYTTDNYYELQLHSGFAIASDIEQLITDILGVPSERHTFTTPYGVNAWRVSTSLMAIRRYKSGKIKFTGLTEEQWLYISNTIKELYRMGRKRVGY